MRKLFLILILLMFTQARSADFDSTRHVSMKVFSLLGVDTAGSTNLLLATVGDYVNYGIWQVNNDLQSYRRVTEITSASGVRFTILDSVINIVSCQLINGDTIIGLHVIRSQEIGDSVVAIENNTEDVDVGKYPEYIFKWSDSIGFVPTPVQTNTFQILYTHIIPEDSLRLIPFNDRLGVLYYALFLAADDINDPNMDVYFKMYESFIAKRVGLK